MDRRWMRALRTSEEYMNGVEEFIAFAQTNDLSKKGMYLCPCVKYLNETPQNIHNIRDHLLCEGINLRYRKWIWHGELESTALTSQNMESVNDIGKNRMEDMIDDIGAESFYRLHEDDNLRSDAETQLYPGCIKYTRLTAVLKLMNLKASNGWTDKGFIELLEVLSDMLPDNNILPDRMYDAKKILSKMGMEYKKIHACPNDCVLYKNGYERLTEFQKCKSSRYKVKNEACCAADSRKGQHLKVLWYLPIIPRFRCLYANVREAKKLRWHYDERISDGRYLRHPADSPQWKKIDKLFLDFGSKPRNLRLGLCTNGFNLFGSLSSTHSA